MHTSRIILDMFEQQLNIQVSAMRSLQRQLARFWHIPQRQGQLDTAVRKSLSEILEKRFGKTA